MSCITYLHNDPFDSGGTKFISGTTCEGSATSYNLTFGSFACMEAELPLIICDGLTISGSCSPILTTPTPTPTNTSSPTSTTTSTPTPTPTSTSGGATPTPTRTSTPTPTPTGTSSGTTPTPTSTPTQTPAITIYTHGVVLATCSLFCNANYNIDVANTATANFASLTIGDTIFGQGGVAGFVAYAATSTDTATGVFRIAQIDSSGVITGIFICVGGSCEPL